MTPGLVPRVSKAEDLLPRSSDRAPFLRDAKPPIREQFAYARFTRASRGIARSGEPTSSSERLIRIALRAAGLP